MLNSRALPETLRQKKRLAALPVGAHVIAACANGQVGMSVRFPTHTSLVQGHQAPSRLSSMTVIRQSVFRSSSDERSINLLTWLLNKQHHT